MRIIYPSNPLNLKEADEPYQDEVSFLRSSGVDCSLFDFDALVFDEFKPEPKILAGEVILYRGWMLSPSTYRRLTQFITNKGGTLVTSYENYLKCHHLPNWYDLCSEFTAESRFFSNDENLENKLESLAWGSYFVKDYVKSNTTEKGSVASSPKEVLEVVELIKKFRGEIEGGIVVRRVENYKTETEVRYFVFNGKAYSPDNEIPDIVIEIARKVNAPFYSVDIVQREDGILRLIELGDGQVSDKKTWSTKAFSKVVLDNVA